MICRAVGEIELVISSKTCNFASYSYRNILNSSSPFCKWLLRENVNRPSNLRDGWQRCHVETETVWVCWTAFIPAPGLRLRNLSSLKLLNLSRNALEELPPSLFDGLNLSVIDLSHNKLRTLNATQFDLENLTTLDLRGNRLTDATREDLARLKVELHVDWGCCAPWNWWKLPSQLGSDSDDLKFSPLRGGVEAATNSQVFSLQSLDSEQRLVAKVARQLWR